MKRLNFNIKDRKVLYMILGIVFISVFTLTVAYAALNAVLNISGSAQVSSAEWDVHFDNVKVTSGSVSADDPRITSPTTATFSTVLNMPGDFYEFTIDVVNDGSIDAMIENITKTPTLSSGQAKYLRYDITYQNGESITTRQLVEKKSFVRLKVRLEFRNDLSSSDLPTSSETLNLGLKLDYIQSDGTGSSVTDNGIYDPYKIGNEICFDTECFYVMYSDEETVTMLAKYNLYVGGEFNNYTWTAYGNEATGKQDPNMLGWVGSGQPYKGTIAFSSDTQHGTNYSDYSGSIVEGYVNNYKSILETEYGVDVVEARLITKDELTSDKIGCSVEDSTCTGSAYPWIYSTSYWSGSPDSIYEVWYVYSSGTFEFDYYDCFFDDSYGVRPVIVIPKSEIIVSESSVSLIEFNIDYTTYQAEEGMTWEEWVDSEYNVDNFVVDYDEIKNFDLTKVITAGTGTSNFIVILKSSLIESNFNYNMELLL